jgi:hypothetical protein
LRIIVILAFKDEAYDHEAALINWLNHGCLSMIDQMRHLAIWKRLDQELDLLFPEWQSALQGTGRKWLRKVDEL